MINSIGDLEPVLNISDDEFYKEKTEVKIADTRIAYRNKDLINLLKKRGDYIAYNEDKIKLI